MDGTPKVVEFADALERVCIEAVEAGDMTKDLAILIAKDAPYLYTEDFLDAIDERLQAKMAGKPAPKAKTAPAKKAPAKKAPAKKAPAKKAPAKKAPAKKVARKR
jgi:hypothetical protein